MAETPPDRIYLQSGRPGPVWRLPTWQEVAMHDDDTEYLRATPERLAAGDAIAALENALRAIESLDVDALGMETIQETESGREVYPIKFELEAEIKSALAKARGEHDG